jgi:hypothetical protein
MSVRRLQTVACRRHPGQAVPLHCPAPSSLAASVFAAGALEVNHVG